jgi:hypothetical protein
MAFSFYRSLYKWSRHGLFIRKITSGGQLMSRTKLELQALEQRDVPSSVRAILESRVEEHFEDSTGRNGFAVVADGHTNRSINGDQVFGTSSTIKLGILYALMRHIDNQRFQLPPFRATLNSTIDVGSQYATNQGNTLAADTRVSLRTLAETMIENSNNWATNRLIDYLGVSDINDEFADLGLTKTRLDRYMTGPNAPSMHGLGTNANGAGPSRDYRSGHDNESTPNEIVSLLRQVHENNGLLLPETYTEFWRIMSLNDGRLSDHAYVTQTYDSTVFTGSAASWAGALSLASKPGSNGWTGSPGDFGDDPSLGDHFQRSEAGRILFSDGRVAFYGMFVDEAADSAGADAALGFAGFEIAREFITNAVTVSPIGGELQDGFTAVLRGSAADDRINLRLGGTNQIRFTLNQQFVRDVGARGNQPLSVVVFADGGNDDITVEPGLSFSQFASLDILGGDGSDRITATPSTSAFYLLQGGSHTTEGDHLIYLGNGTRGESTPPHVARAGYKNVFYSTFERAFDSPVISNLADLTAPKNRVLDPIPFQISDLESPADRLTVTASMSTGSIVLPIPGSNVTVTGTGSDRTLAVTLPGKFIAPVVVTVVVTDETGNRTSSSFRIKPSSQAAPPQFSIGADAGNGRVVLKNPDNTQRYSLTPFGSEFVGGIRTASGDFTGDGVADLVVGTGPGSSTQVKIFDGVTQTELFSLNPFEAAFTGGVYVAAGDIDGDGIADLVITPDEGGGPRVRAFTGEGFTQIADFFGIDDKNFRGGARASIGDLNGDGSGDLVVVAGFGGGPRVAAFDGAQLKSNGGPKLFNDFFASEQALRNGIFVAAGDVNGDGFADLVAGGGPGGGPRVYILDGKSLVQNGSISHVPLGNFFAGDPASRGGVRVAIKNLDNDDMADVVTGAGSGAGSRVTAYLGTNITPTGTPPAFLDFDAFVGYGGGVFVG